jgi:hypothetical protein
MQHATKDGEHKLVRACELPADREAHAWSIA